MLKTGIYVDAENIRLCGGYGMRYDVLVDLANSGNSALLRANSYMAEDQKRTEIDREYRLKLYSYHDILRTYGFKVVKKFAQHYVDENGVESIKANADMDLAIDAILQARNLDRVILISGDGDFVRLVTSLQNMGCRVEVIGFNNVNSELKKSADFYINGFLVPGLIPISSERDGEEWHRGTVITYKQEKGFGFIRYFVLTDNGLVAKTIFFHCSKSCVEEEQYLFSNPSNIFEFKVSADSREKGKFEATNIEIMRPVLCQ